MGKNTEINKQSHVKFWINRRNMELSHIFLAVNIAEMKFRIKQIFLSNFLIIHTTRLVIEQEDIFFLLFPP